MSRLKPAYELTLQYVDYFFPVAMPAILVPMPWLIGHLASQGGARGSFGADLVFSTIAFWIWGLTTNAHSGFLVRGSGRIRGTKEQRKKEFLAILFMLLVAIVLYIATYLVGQELGLILAFASFIGPVLILGTP